MSKPKNNNPYKQIFPELKDALYALQHVHAWNIFVYIITHKKVPINDIYYLPQNPPFRDPINLLTQAGLITRKTTDITDINKCYYTPTKTGKMLMEALINVYLPKISIEPKEKQNL